MSRNTLSNPVTHILAAGIGAILAVMAFICIVYTVATAPAAEATQPAAPASRPAAPGAEPVAAASDAPADYSRPAVSSKPAAPAAPDYAALAADNGTTEDYERVADACFTVFPSDDGARDYCLEGTAALYLEPGSKLAAYLEPCGRGDDVSTIAACLAGADKTFQDAAADKPGRGGQVDAQPAPQDARPLPACEQEDSDGPCFWNAQTQGNGRGSSFIALPGDRAVLIAHWQAAALAGQ